MLIALSQTVYSLLNKKSSTIKLTDCQKEFQDKCLNECKLLKRELCFCKDYQFAHQLNHKCLCAPNKTQCGNELQQFIDRFLL